MTTIAQAQRMVGQFHAKLGLLERAKLERSDGTGENGMLYEAGQAVLALSKRLESWSSPRAMRAHLILEELGGELLDAMSRGNEIETLDALADALYILLGTAEVFNLPLEQAFLEVHKSNMTKERQSDDAAAHRVRKKGPNYQPPNIKQVLEEYRSSQSTKDNPHRTTAPMGY